MTIGHNQYLLLLNSADIDYKTKIHKLQIMIGLTLQSGFRLHATANRHLCHLITV